MPATSAASLLLGLVCPSVLAWQTDRTGLQRPTTDRPPWDAWVTPPDAGPAAIGTASSSLARTWPRQESSVDARVFGEVEHDYADAQPLAVDEGAGKLGGRMETSSRRLTTNYTLLEIGQTCAGQGYEEVSDETACFGDAASSIEELSGVPVVDAQFSFSCVYSGGVLFFGDGAAGIADSSRQYVCQGDQQPSSTRTSTTSFTTVSTRTLGYDPTAVAYPDVCQTWYFHIVNASTRKDRNALCFEASSEMTSIQPQSTANILLDLPTLGGCVFSLGGGDVSFFNTEVQEGYEYWLDICNGLTSSTESSTLSLTSSATLSYSTTASSTTRSSTTWTSSTTGTTTSGTSSASGTTSTGSSTTTTTRSTETTTLTTITKTSSATGTATSATTTATTTTPTHYVLLPAGTTCAEAGYHEVPDKIGCFSNASDYIGGDISGATTAESTGEFSCALLFGTLVFGDGSAGTADTHRQYVCQGEEPTTSATTGTTSSTSVITTTPRYDPTAIVYPDVCQVWYFYVASASTLAERHQECSDVAYSMTSIGQQHTIAAVPDSGLAGCVFDLGGELITYFDSEQSTSTTSQVLQAYEYWLDICDGLTDTSSTTASATTSTASSATETSSTTTWTTATGTSSTTPATSTEATASATTTSETRTTTSASVSSSTTVTGTTGTSSTTRSSSSTASSTIVTSTTGTTSSSRSGTTSSSRSGTTSSSRSGTSSSSTSETIEASDQVVGSLLLLFSDPYAFLSIPEQPQKVLDSVGLTISQVVGLPASYVSVWFAESRRLTAATRHLSGTALEVEFSIDVPAGSAAGVPDVGAVEAALERVDVASFTLLLQMNIDSSVGEGLYSVQVVTVDVGPSVPDGSDDAGSSSTPVTMFVLAGVLLCIGFEFPVLALFCWLRRRRLPREQSNQAPGPRPEGHDGAESGHAKRGGAAKGARLPEEHDQAQLWTYTPVNGKAITARGEPEFSGKKTGKKLSPGDTFRVVEEKKVGETTFLKLADGEGWLFDMKPEVGLMCTKTTAAGLAPGNVVELHGLVPGSVVELQGFRGSAHLNGLRGRVAEWMPGRGRYLVELADGAAAQAVCPINLAPCDCDGEEPAAALSTAGGPLDVAWPRIVQPGSAAPHSPDGTYVDGIAPAFMVQPSSEAGQMAVWCEGAGAGDPLPPPLYV